MIIYDSTEMRTYWNDELSTFCSGSFVVIIVDQYFGGTTLSQKENIKDFIYLLVNTLNAPKIIWFYDSSRLTFDPLSLPEVEAKDLSDERIRIHDRFIFLFDATEKIYARQWHLGSSINGFSVAAAPMPSAVPICRISYLDELDKNTQRNMLSSLEISYGRKDWGC